MLLYRNTRHEAKCLIDRCIMLFLVSDRYRQYYTAENAKSSLRGSGVFARFEKGHGFCDRREVIAKRLAVPSGFLIINIKSSHFNLFDLRASKYFIFS